MDARKKLGKYLALLNLVALIAGITAGVVWGVLEGIIAFLITLLTATSLVYLKHKDHEDSDGNDKKVDRLIVPED